MGWRELETRCRAAHGALEVGDVGRDVIAAMRASAHVLWLDLAAASTTELGRRLDGHSTATPWHGRSADALLETLGDIVEDNYELADDDPDDDALVVFDLSGTDPALLRTSIEGFEIAEIFRLFITVSSTSLNRPRPGVAVLVPEGTRPGFGRKPGVGPARVSKRAVGGKAD